MSTQPPDPSPIAAELDARLAAIVDRAQRRQVERRATRAEFAQRRTAGLNARHNAKLARTDTPTTDHTQETAVDEQQPGNRVPPGSRMDADTSEAPPRRQGVRSGYPGKVEYGAADRRVRVALSKLARDVDPAARQLGAELAARATQMLADIAREAEAGSTRNKKLAREVERVSAQLDRRLAAAHGKPNPSHPPSTLDQAKGTTS